MQELRSLSQFNKLKSSSTLLIIDFYATWCGPCKVISPHFERLAKLHGSSTSTVFAKCDVDKANDVAQACGITAMPTFQFFKGGDKVDEVKGADVQQLTTKIGYYTAAARKDEGANTSPGGQKAAGSKTEDSNPGSLRSLIDVGAGKLLNCSNLSSVLNVAKPPPAGNAVTSASGPKLLIYLPFTQAVTPSRLKIAIPKDSIPHAPSRIQIGANVPVLVTKDKDGVERSDLDMESLSKAENAQAFNVFSDEYNDGVTELKLKASKFQGIKSLMVRVDANLSGEDTVVKEHPNTQTPKRTSPRSPSLRRPQQDNMMIRCQDAKPGFEAGGRPHPGGKGVGRFCSHRLARTHSHPLAPAHTHSHPLPPTPPPLPSAIADALKRALVVLTFIAGGIKVFYNKRQLAKNTKIADLEAAGKLKERENLVQREFDEGDLFGVRALEHGFFGGVSQSRPTSPAPGSIAGSAESIKLKGISGSAASSVIDLPSMRNSNFSPITAPQPAKTKPAALRLQPSDAELMGRSRHSMISFGTNISSPLVSPKSPEGVAPLDPHFDGPSTGNSQKRKSYVPQQVQSSEENELKTRVVPAPSLISRVKSETASIVGPSPESNSERFSQGPPSSYYPPQPTFQRSRGSERSIFPMRDQSESRPSSNRINKPFDLTLQPEPNSDGAIIRDVSNKQIVSVTTPQEPEFPPESIDHHTRNYSTAASSTYSTTTSILEISKEDAQPKPRSKSPESSARGRGRPRTHHARSSSSSTLSRTRDSVLHNRKSSADTMKEDKRRSKDRDQIHFDPRQHYRNGSGSVQGRSVDFDRPRSSPFSSASDHSVSSSTSSPSSASTSSPSSASTLSPQSKHESDTPTAPLNLNFRIDTSRLSAIDITSGRSRSASEASQSSMIIGDFYDAYYRQSILAARNSGIPLQDLGQTTAGDLLSAPNANLGVGIALSSSNGLAPSKRLQPLKLGVNIGETIEELPSPLPSPSPVMAKERFPSMLQV
ncbi:hypothetical protein B7494_g5467 [Chlorociboria aeruginascens]|nr:hypothetical protein B7494_g5467 [Chlorociboria aeruginascens]